MLYRLLRPLLFCFEPERAHKLSLQLLKCFGWVVATKNRSSKPINLFGLRFDNPVGLAAGMDKNGDYIDALFKLGFGFIEIGGVTPLPQKGNPKPRLHRLVKQQAFINCMNFNNYGVDHLLEGLKWRKSKGVVGVNIARNDHTATENAFDDYAICIKKLYAYADFLTINVSCPNTPGLQHLQNKAKLDDLLSKVSELRTRLQSEQDRYVPILVKLSPDLSDVDLQDAVSVIQQRQFDGIIATNSSTVLKVNLPEPYRSTPGGLSGRPLTHNTVRMVRKIRSLTSLPIIAVGGIMSADDAKLMQQAGANLVQLYTGFVYQGPKLVHEVAKAYADK